jgi:hypothetical protein
MTDGTAHASALFGGYDKWLAGLPHFRNNAPANEDELETHVGTPARLVASQFEADNDAGKASVIRRAYAEVKRAARRIDEFCVSKRITGTRWRSGDRKFQELARSVSNVVSAPVDELMSEAHAWFLHSPGSDLKRWALPACWFATKLQATGLSHEQTAAHIHQMLSRFLVRAELKDRITNNAIRRVYGLRALGWQWLYDQIGPGMLAAVGEFEDHLLQCFPETLDAEAFVPDARVSRRRSTPIAEGRAERLQDILSRGPRTFTQIVNILGLENAQVNRILQRSMEAGTIERQQDGHYRLKSQ